MCEHKSSGGSDGQSHTDDFLPEEYNIQIPAPDVRITLRSGTRSVQRSCQLYFDFQYWPGHFRVPHFPPQSFQAR